MRERRGWWLTFSILTAVMAVSALTIPLMGAPDEPAHTVKAVAVARGELDTAYERQAVGGPFASSVPLTTVEVPDGYARLRGQMACWSGREATPASCAPRLTDLPGTVEAGTYVGTYPAPYYAVVGLPSLVLAPRPAVYAMRLVSALIVAALLATAVMSARRATRRPLVMAGLALAITPMVVFLGGTINPNAVEIAAAIALWCALLELLSEAQRTPDARMALRLAVPAGIMVTQRPLSPALVLAMVGFLVVALAEPAALRERWRSRPLRVAAATVAGLALAMVLYLVLTRSLSAFVEFAVLKERSAGDVIRDVPSSTGDLAEQMVAMLGLIGIGAVRFPAWMLRVWLGAALGLAVAAVVLARSRVRIALALLVAGVVALPVLAQLANRGVGWQGRHSLPVAVGIPIVAGWALDRSERVAASVARAVSTTVVGLTAGLQIYIHQRYMTRVVVGLPNGLFDSLTQGRWHGPLTPWILLLVYVAAWVAFALVLLAPPADEPTRSASPEAVPVTSAV